MPQIQSAVEDAIPQVRRAFETVGGAAKDVGGFLKGCVGCVRFDAGRVKKAAVDLTAVAVALGALKATGVTGGIKVAFDMGKVPVLGRAGHERQCRCGERQRQGWRRRCGNGAKFTGGTGAMLTGMSQGASRCHESVPRGAGGGDPLKLNVDRAAAREASGSPSSARGGCGRAIATGSARFISDGNRAADAARRLEGRLLARVTRGQDEHRLERGAGASDRASRTVSGLARSQSDYRRALGELHEDRPPE